MGQLLFLLRGTEYYSKPANTPYLSVIFSVKLFLLNYILGLLGYLTLLVYYLDIIILFCNIMIKHKYLKFMSVNIRGISSQISKQKDLFNYLLDNNIDICLLQEWKINFQNCDNNSFNIELPSNYEIITKCDYLQE